MPSTPGTPGSSFGPSASAPTTIAGSAESASAVQFRKKPHGHSLFQAREVVHLAQTNVPEAPKNQLAMRDERFKLIYFPEDERFELYDLQQDPGETTNVFAARASERKEWPERLHRLYLGGGALEGGSSDEVHEEMLRALGYGGGGNDEGEEDGPAGEDDQDDQGD